MYCTACGKEIEPGARFCNHCGAPIESQMNESAGNSFEKTVPLNTSGAASSENAPVTSASSKRTPLSRNAKIGIAIGAVVIIVLVIIALVFLLPNQSQDNSTPTESETKTTVIDRTQSQDQSQDQNSGQSSSQDTASDADASESSSQSGTASDAYNESSIEGYTLYTNGRFGYSIAYPNYYLVPYVSENGSGITIEDNNDEEIRIDVWGNNNSAGETLDERFTSLVETVGIEGYTASGDTWYVYSYEANGRVIYTKEYVGSGSIATMSISYPRSMSSVGDALVEAVAPTFEPGDTSVAH